MTGKKYHNFLESELKPLSPKEALFHVIPVPYEKSVTYGQGTANGPAAILEASSQLELFDGIGIPAEHGIYTHASIDCRSDAEIVLDTVSNRVSKVLQLEKIPILLGGEHTITAGALQAVKKHFSKCGVVQFDAHADLRDVYEGNRFSHACVMRRVLDLGLPIFQIGVRSLSYEEQQLRQKKNIGRLDAAVIADQGLPDKILPREFPNYVYLTLDVDVFDPSMMPATGTPEPGGLSWYQILQAIESILIGRRIIGFDVVELAPIAGMHAPDYTIARFIYNMCGMISRNINFAE